MGQRAEDFAAMEVSRSPAVMAGEAYVDRPEVRRALEDSRGRLRLSGRQAGDLSGVPDALGGLLLTAEASMEAFSFGLLIMDSDLSHEDLEKAAPVVKPGATLEDILQAAAILKVRAGDAVVFEKGDQLPVDAVGVRNLVVERIGSRSSLPRLVVVGDREGFKLFPATGIIQLLFGEDGFPDVAFLGLAITFKDRSDQEYSLIVWT
jgi:hypothetical protein